MTTVEDVSIGLPEPAPTQISEPDDSRDRRWLTEDGMAIVVTVVPPDEPAEFDPLALDMVLGATLRRYVDELSGVVEASVKAPIPGFTAGRAARLAILSSNDEPTGVGIVAGQAPDRDIVVLQLTWPLAMADQHLQTAERVLSSFSLRSP